MVVPFGKHTAPLQDLNNIRDLVTSHNVTRKRMSVVSTRVPGSSSVLSSTSDLQLKGYRFKTKDRGVVIRDYQTSNNRDTLHTIMVPYVLTQTI